jgi:hypothetical protein
MTQAIEHYTPSRRALLGGATVMLTGAASTAALGAVTAAGGPDADVIRLSGEYYNLELAWRDAFTRFPDTCQGDDDREVFQEPIRARQEEIADILAEMPSPRTLLGFRALARALSPSANEASAGPANFTGTELQLAYKLVQGLAEEQA